MTVSELSKKYNMQATDVDKYVQLAGLQNLSVTAPIPNDVLIVIEQKLQADGHKPVKKRAMLIKKSRQPDPSVAQVRKKIVIKKRTQPTSQDEASEPQATRPEQSRPVERQPASGTPRTGTRPPASGYSRRPARPAYPRSDQGSRPARPGFAGSGRPGFGGGRPSYGGRPAPDVGSGPIGQGPDRRKGAASRGRDRDRRDKMPDRRWNDRAEMVRRSTFKKKSKRETQLESVPDKIEIMESLTVSELARKMNLPAKEIISKLMSMGMMTTINQQIDADTATLVASEYGCTVKQISLYDETVIEEAPDNPERVIPRPPVVTVMGHVDHGKTKLLDAIRSSKLADAESGGITQHIGSYLVKTPQGPITFIDTPGHEAFSMMRTRGAKLTDIVILVVAADDGVKPQTVEAAKSALEADVPIVVAINKMDKPEANLDRVKQQLADKLNLLPEDWGGKTICVPISALKKEGIDDLLEAVLLQAEMLELKADPEKPGNGTILEARIDLGKGITVKVLCQGGKMAVGDSFVAGVHYGRIRAMYNEYGKNIDRIGPSISAELLGSSGLPQAGDPFHVVENEKKARMISLKRLELKKFEDAKTVKKVTLENIFDKIKDEGTKELKVIIKADMQGSAEALKDSLEKIENEEVRLNCIRYSAGAINEEDIMLASTSKAIVIGFHVRPNNRAREMAERENVEIKIYTIIYDAINEIDAALRGMMTPELHEKISGSAEVRDTFKVPKVGTIAGCLVIDGSILRNNNVRVIRDGEVIFEGKISSLKRFKDDAREVQKGYECGIGVDGYDDVRVGDILETYSIQEVIPGKAGKEN